ncbi:MAG: hypothetical protein IH932_03740 [Thaumarchaeota archaeon]|nr:hypothetical protein [Nitrososphaerota archaeon]
MLYLRRGTNAYSRSLASPGSVFGITSSAPRDDLQKLNHTIKEMRKSLTPPLSLYKIFPILLTTVDTIHSGDAEFAAELDIIVIKADDIRKLLDMSETGRTSTDLVEFLESNERDIMYNEFTNKRVNN